LVIALGTNIGEQFDISSLRYHRIVIMTDADVDGAHIRTLLLTLFYRYFPELIRQGHLYIAQPPLYRVQKGSVVKYAYSDSELEQVKKEFEKIKVEEKKKSKKEELVVSEEMGELQTETEISGLKLNIQRYKGLGEMNPGQLWETTMDPAQRVMKFVTIEDATKADEIFDILMGSDVSPRKQFIHSHAKNVKNLDI